MDRTQNVHANKQNFNNKLLALMLWQDGNSYNSKNKGMQIYRGVMKRCVTCTYNNSNDSHLIESMLYKNSIKIFFSIFGLNYKWVQNNVIIKMPQFVFSN
jgi:hypothetical protein